MLNSAPSTAVDQSFLRAFIAVRIELRSGSTLNLIDGSGVVTFPVDGTSVTFTGNDPVFGAIASASNIEERVAEEAPRFTFSMMPPNETALGTLMQPTQQGSPVRVWWGLVNEQTGAVIGTEQLWSGLLDTVKSNAAENVLLAEIDTVSAFDRFFAAEEGARLNGVWHRSVWAGETGLDFVYDAQQSISWGTEAPAKQAVTSYGSGTRGGGGIDRNGNSYTDTY